MLRCSTKVTLTRLPWSSLTSCGAAVQSQPFFASRGRAERNHGCLGCLMVNRMIEQIRVDAMINPGPKIIQSPCKKKTWIPTQKTPGFKKKRNPKSMVKLVKLNGETSISFRSCYHDPIRFVSCCNQSNLWNDQGLVQAVQRLRQRGAIPV